MLQVIYKARLPSFGIIATHLKEINCFNTKAKMCLCELLEVSLGGYIRFYTFFWPAEFPGYHQWQQESQ